MKNNSVVMRLDELNRVKIPKEFMKELKLRSGDPLKFFIEDGRLVVELCKDDKDYV